jgi:hypothetical protein
MAASSLSAFLSLFRVAWLEDHEEDGFHRRLREMEVAFLLPLTAYWYLSSLDPYQHLTSVPFFSEPDVLLEIARKRFAWECFRSAD